MTRARSFGLIWPYLVAVPLGYLLGSLAVPALAAWAGDGSNTALSRVGFVLRADPRAAPPAWSALHGDIEAVRAGLASPEREVFDLVVAVRGLNHGGQSDWSHAEQICRSLAWPRCERAALEQLKEQSRP